MSPFAKPVRPDKPYSSLVAGGASLQFYLGDCLEVLSQLPPESVDVIVTSPPYNLGIRYRSYQDNRPRADYLSWTAEWVQAAARLLRPDGSLFLNVGAKPTDPWTAFDVAEAVRPHLHLQNLIHWIKSIVIDQDSPGSASALDATLAVGHYKPINSERFLNDCHEFVFHFTTRGTTAIDRLALGVPYQDPSNISRWGAGASGLRCRGNTWFIPYETIQRRDRDRPHPATFPPRLPEYCLRLHGLSSARVVMDPFTGLGSTAVACARLGADFIGVEMDQTYLDQAIERTRQTRVDMLPRPAAGAEKPTRLQGRRQLKAGLRVLGKKRASETA